MDNDLKRRLEDTLKARGGMLGPAPLGPVVQPGPDQWARVAAAIEQEAEKFGSLGKISLHMDVPDALALAQELRRRVKRSS